ncbi:GNAT family N-acetyltransferase [Streptomyces uncialis]|uniref:GCN5 family acetyltransferase n=1 Tax=Streptomyces uncialis TaxID=1048205 RepID=A0A1Q4VDE9_9ACTN|nr:GNAT family N-acetyltransferase [Streptomyces uncialis]OKH95863.1 GCN5 family acetyltransferase [Streptomyces uncialis]
MDTFTIRKGGPGDLPAVLALMDRAVEWLAARGRTGQWGTEPWSTNPRAVEMVTRYAGEGDLWLADAAGAVVGTLTLTDGPGSYVPRADEPERYIHVFATDRRRAGEGIGAALLAHAADETRRAGRSLLRVDCYAGDDGKLVAYYEGQGFTPAERFTVGEDAWPGQVLARRV